MSDSNLALSNKKKASKKSVAKDGGQTVKRKRKVKKAKEPNPVKKEVFMK